MIASLATTLSAWLGVVTVGISALVAAVSYRGKARADEAESDVRLAGLFAELVPLANGRAGSAYPDAVLAEVFKLDSFRVALGEAETFEEATAVIGQAGRLAAVSGPVGRATQAAVVVALGELGKKHKVLREPVRTALTGLSFLGDAAYNRDDTALRDALTNAKTQVD